jgi:hypothetical protein
MQFEITGKCTVAAFVNNKFRAPRLTENGAVTNGMWLLYTKYCPKPLLNRVNEEAIRPDDTDVYPKYGKSESIYDMWPGTVSHSPVYFAVMSDTRETVAFDRGSINYLARWIKGLVIRPTGDATPAYILSGDKIAGIIMPIRI